ncbi:transcriptional repressor TCF25-domain-containing protein [Mucor lusitanicus]
MSSRALKRLQKEQLSAIAPEKSDEEVVDSEEEDHVQGKPIKQINPFDLLNGDDDDDVAEEEEEEEQEEEQVEEIKKPEPVTEKSFNNTKKNKKKNKKKNNKNDNQTSSTDDMSMKELDRVLKQLGKTSSKTAKNNQSFNTEERRQLLAVNYRHLNAQAEMKRLFGSHVVNTENRASQGRVLKMSKFTTPKSDWPPYKRHGLSMEVVETKDGITYYAFRHSEQYQDAQAEFLHAVSTHNPHALLFLTRTQPYHVDSLLQLSEISKQSGDWHAAGDFIERALYACERAFHPQFSLATGTARLSYKKPENRSFFLAVFRQIQFLTRRGCWKTAFEFNKLLFSLDPVSDPLGALLSLDYHALSAKEYEYVLKMQSEWKTDGRLYPVNLADMPNFAYSSAYAKFKMSEKSKNSEDVVQATLMMKEAIQKYPLVYCRLLEKLGESEPEEMVQLTQYIPNEYMEIVQLSYIERTFEMWKEPEVLEWFKGVGSSTLPVVVSQPQKIQQKLLCQEKDAVPLSVSRYIVLIDIQKLMSYLPWGVTSTSYHMYDPLPPPDSESSYSTRERASLGAGSGVHIGDGRQMDAQTVINAVRELLASNRLAPASQAEAQALLEELERHRADNVNHVPGAFPADADQYPELVQELRDAAEEEEEEQGEEEDEDWEPNPTRLPNNDADMDEEEMRQIMEAAGEDFDVQVALAQAFERNNQ